MKVIKPIFTIGFPSGNIGSGKDWELIEKSLENKLCDYHVLIYTGEFDNLKMDLFNSKDIDDIMFEELKQIVKDSVK